MSNPQPSVLTAEAALAKYESTIRHLATTHQKRYGLPTPDVDDLISALQLHLIQIDPVKWSIDDYVFIALRNEVRRLAAITRKHNDRLISGDSPTEPDGTPVFDRLQAPGVPPDADRRPTVAEFLAVLTDRQKKIITAMYGLDGLAAVTDLYKLAPIAGLKVDQRKQVQHEIDCAMFRMRRLAGVPEKLRKL